MSLYDKVQKDPKRNIWCVPVEDKTLMLSGHRVSASRVKQQNLKDRADAKSAFESASSKIQAKTNCKDCFSFLFISVRACRV